MSTLGKKNNIPRLAGLQVGSILRYNSDSVTSGRLYLIVAIVQNVAMARLFNTAPADVDQPGKYCTLSSDYGLAEQADPLVRYDLRADVTRLIIKEADLVQSLLTSGALKLLRKVRKPDLTMVQALLRRASTLSQVEKDMYL